MERAEESILIRKPEETAFGIVWESCSQLLGHYSFDLRVTFGLTHSVWFLPNRYLCFIMLLSVPGATRLESCLTGRRP